jgi:hypothetical protein
MALQLDDDVHVVAAPPSRRRSIVVWAILATTALLAAAVVALAARDRSSSTTTTPTQPTAPTVSTPSPQETTPAIPNEPTTPTNPTPPPGPAKVDTTTAVWPRTGSALRYHEPQDAAHGYAVQFLGFRDPVVGKYKAGDLRSGEVTIKPNTSGPTTTVFVRQLGSSGDWWVIGSSTPNIQLAAPTALEKITSPAHLSGTSTAFEGQVNVRIYADGVDKPIVERSIMGGSMGEMRPFDATIQFPAPRSSAGTIVLSTTSMEDGTTAEASTVRVLFTES